MGDGSGDLQRVWQEFVGRQLLPLTPAMDILDVGAGVGRSKSRLSNGRHRVTTHDVNRANMTNVDVIADVTTLTALDARYDVVTAFDVVEHAPNPVLLIAQMATLARILVFFTTPNHAVYPHPWHFTPTEIEELAKAVPSTSLRYFRRDKEGERDAIREVSREAFMNDTPHAYALGVAVYLEQR